MTNPTPTRSDRTGETSIPRIWIVDDSPVESEHIRRALAGGDFDASFYLDGARVVERLALDAPPDILVLDWLLRGCRASTCVASCERTPR